MPHAPGDRIFGVETEFGCLVSDESFGTPEGAVELVKDSLFFDLHIGAIDLHARDEVFEPAANGGFLVNGGRMYIDAVGTHLEYATAECRDLRNLVANDRAGQRLIVQALKELGLEDAVAFYNNSVDHFGGHTFGCHENYLVRANDEFLSFAPPLLYPFLVTRQIFAGVGRVGGHLLTTNYAQPTYEEVVNNPIDYIWVSNVYGVVPDHDVPFQLSQRADHIIKTIAGRVRFNRALINPKWEHFYSHDGMQRLHLLFGESNQNEYAYALKVGTTHLVLRLLEEHRVPESLQLAEPLIALRQVSRDQDFRWLVERADGGTIGAVDLQREYLALAQTYRGTNDDTDWTLDAWESVLDGLAADPMTLADRVDWVAKRQIVEQYMAEEGLDWSSDALHSVDLEYHNINPEQSLFHAMQGMGQTQRMASDLDILDAMTSPPQNTRAKARAACVKHVLDRKSRRYYAFDWNAAAVDKQTFFEFDDPFDTYEDVRP